MSMKFNFYAVAAFLFLALAAKAQTTAFTYQGRLNSNNVPVTGAFDLRFKIYDTNNSVVATPLTNAPVGVANGLFITTLDFGPGVFDGSMRWLEIGVRTNGDTNAYIVLSPRQTLTSTPYAIQSLNAVNASNAVILTMPLPATNMVGTIPNSLLSPNVAVLTNNVIFSGGVTAVNFTGNGAGLTGLNATNINTGTLSDAQLSANVALQSNPNLSFAGAVSATNFTGAGHGLTNVPGAFFWVTVAGTNTLAQPNVGYICTNDMNPVTITLPPSLSIGDTFRVAGVGGAGWIVAQANGQTIFTGNLGDAAGQNWKTSGPSAYWSAVASSASGIKMVATSNGGKIFTTTNSGATWSTNATPQIWSSVASSADGTRLVATVGNSTGSTGPIYTSTDSGMTWTSQSTGSGNRQWVSVASSADGSRLVAAVYNGNIYTSVNYGANWTARDNQRFWTAVTSSADGKKLVAAVTGGNIYTSTNFGTNWTAQTGSGSLTWSALASSSDGTRLIAATGGGSGQVYISSDSGVTWTVQTVSSTAGASWSSVASSSDGSHLAAVYNVTSAGYIFTSSDSGVTWSQRTGAPNADWAGVAMSADGSQIVAVPDPGFVYISSQASTTTGTSGSVRGAQHTALELQYVGNGLFLPLSHEGTIRAY
jgi:photosystem II stability/assembly factor-like uncharacterized protein